MSNRKRRLVLVSHKTEAKTDKNGNPVLDANGEVQTWEIDVYKDLNDYHYLLYRYENGLEQEHYTGRQLETKVRKLGRVSSKRLGGPVSDRGGQTTEKVEKIGTVPTNAVEAGLPVRQVY